MCAIAAWALTFLGSFVAFYLTPVRDFSLSAGWNKVSVFMAWQLVATALAFGCLALARWLPKGSLLQRLSLVPAVATAALAVAIAALSVYASMSRTPPELVPDRSVTQTAPVRN